MSIVHVFHANGAAWIGMHREEGHVEWGIKWFKMGLYIHTAAIACEDEPADHEVELNQAYEDTTHSTYDWWMDNINVVAQYWERPGYLECKPRGSSIGDIFFHNDKAYMALADSWAEITKEQLGSHWPVIEELSAT